jgi:hypothetical protein
MILDELGEFCDATALSTSGTGKALIGDVIDLSEVTRDIGNSRPVYLGIQVTTAVTSGGAATCSFILASDSAAAIAVDDTATEHIITFAYPKATLVVGYQDFFPLPLGVGNTWERFVGIIQNVGTAALTAGAINAFLTLDPAAWKSLPDASN